MKFGKTIRKLRESRDMSIAEFAKQVGISPTYLAPIERDVFPPPSEEKVVKIAKALEQDPDELLALAGRIASDLHKIIRKNPVGTAQLLRATRGMSRGELEALIDSVSGGKRRKVARRPAAKAKTRARRAAAQG